ncbi:hypothetical protein PEBR_05018 [Penicillium brasilianum]|uniref:Uncharacterized protein n=1 Tax=Penicillium brasilianum TaxID=104259 RepID=A0A1S9RX08_PENBI|nr:hypothetical protein PEBR_05018 [Penicillium brasilianum]
MVKRQDLPPELLRRIIFFIAPTKRSNLGRRLGGNYQEANDHDLDDDYAWDEGQGRVFGPPYDDLQRLCLTSHLFRDLAQPFLFHSFKNSDLDGGLGQTVSFIRALYLRPDLGQHVRYIDMMFPVGEQFELVNTEDFALFEVAIKDLRLGENEGNWLSGLKVLDLTVLTALVVNKTPHLREMSLVAGELSVNPICHLLDHSPSLLSELETISIEGAETVDFDLAPYHKLFTLPKLKEVRLEFANISGEILPATWAPGTITAEKFEFNCCHIDVAGVRKFMQACKRLTSFIYRDFREDSHVDMPMLSRKPEFNALQLYEAILPHKESLEDLELSFAYDPWDLMNLEERLARRGKLGSFRDFANLEAVSIAHALLPAHPEFPPSLKILHVGDCESSIRDMVGNIAVDFQKGLYPNLTEFGVFSTDITEPIKLPGQIIPAGQTPEECFTSLRDLFKGTKVDFQIILDNLEQDSEDLDLADDYDDYEGYEDNDHEFDEIVLEEMLRGGLGPRPGIGPPDVTIFDALARALGEPPALDGDGASDNSWETDEDD